MERSSTGGLERLPKTVRDKVWDRLQEKGDSTLSRETFEQVMDIADGTVLKHLAWWTIRC